MTEESKHWVGQVINGQFPLRQYLGHTRTSSVFLTDRGDRKIAQAAIKLIAADQVSGERLLSRYKLVAKLSHPHLMSIFESGKCHLDQSDFIYVVMEFAEENLAQIIPQRALTAAEAGAMLSPALEALAYLHAKGFIHGHIKPANIMAVSDQLKLSTDGLVSTRESTPALPSMRAAYDPPEAATGQFSAASDVWSLGVTLFEVLTQRLPVIEEGRTAPVIPENLPAPFLQIVQRCLLTEPRQRITLAEIAAQLNPANPAAPPSRSAQLAQPALASPVVSSRTAQPVLAPSRPAAPSLRSSPSPLRPPMPNREDASTPLRPRKDRNDNARRRFLIPAVALIVVLAVIFGAARLLNRHESQQILPVAEDASSSGKVQPQPSRLIAQPAERTAPPKSAKSASMSISSEAGKPAKQLQPRSLPVRSEAGKTSDIGRVPGEVLQQDVPEVSAKARASIQGKVRVSVKVRVDTSGNVTGAELTSPGPSKYFADLAVKSAHRWEFAPAKFNGQYVPSEWILRYEFGSSTTKVNPQQTSP